VGITRLITAKAQDSHGAEPKAANVFGATSCVTEGKKQDKIESPSVEIPAAELTYQGLQRKLRRICNTQRFKTEAAIKIHTFLSTIE
jgi:hypothetical protein